MLIVDDEPQLLSMLTEHVRDLGYTVLAARDADEAVGLLSSGVAQVDVLISDVQMPGRLDGIGLARWVRQQRLDVLIILSTGFVVEPPPDLAQLHDAPLLEKPYRLSELEACLQRLTQHR